MAPAGAGPSWRLVEGRFVLFWWIGRLGAAALVRQTSGAARLVAEQVFDLGVDAAQIVVGLPALRLKQARVESEPGALAFGHRADAQV